MPGLTDIFARAVPASRLGTAVCHAPLKESGRLRPKGLIGICLFGLFAAGPAAAQADNDPDESMVQDEILVADRIQFFRWKERYGDLYDAELDGLDSLKYIALGENPNPPFLTLGGQYRLRMEAVDNAAFDLSGEDGDYAAIGHRFLLHADVNLHPRLRIFGEIGAYAEDGRDPVTRSVDESEPDLQQGFVELDISPEADGGLRVKLGRQEIAFATSRFLGTRESPNQRRSFDAVLLDARPDGWRLQTFYARPIDLSDKAFGDSTDTSESFYGAYLEGPRTNRSLSFDTFFLFRDADEQSWFQGTAREERRTVGARVFGRNGPWDYDLHFAHQFGAFGKGDIDAWGVASEFGFSPPDSSWHPRFVLRANWASGDKDAADPNLQTFNALYPSLAYFTNAAAYAPTNAWDIHPRLEFTPGERLDAAIGVVGIRRSRRGDGAYGVGYSPLVAPDTSEARGIVTFFNADLTWHATPRADITLNLVHGLAGDVITDAGGSDLSFAALSTSLRF